MELSVVKISSRRGENPVLFFCCSGPLRISYGVGVETFRIIVPDSIDIDFIDDFRCKFSILDEIMECYGGDATKAHIAGTSNGGHAAFALMLMRRSVSQLCWVPQASSRGTIPRLGRKH